VRPVLLAGVLLLNGHGAAAEDLPVFSSSIELVRLDVSVTRQGRPLRGLTARDFEVRDNGALQAVEVVGHEAKPVHAVLALDNSNSLAGERLARLKGAAHALLDVLRPDDTVSVLTFSDRLVLKARGGESRRDAHAAVEATRARLSTSLYDAVFAALTVADPAHGRPVVLIFSDGQDVGSWLRPEQVLRAARAADLVTHAVISQREGSDAHFLEELTAATGGQVWKVGDSELEEAFVTALEEFRSRYTLQYAAGDNSPEPWHDVEVRVRRAGARVRVREGYLREGSAP
jgi:VWFA-related protein